MYRRRIRMTFNWSEYLKLAQELGEQAVSSATQQARLRSSISRAYFAAYCNARNYLRDVKRCSIPSTIEAQRYVRDKFKSSFNRRHRKIGENLDRLRIRRNKVDYDDFVTGLSSMVTISLKLAQQVISILNTLMRK